MDDDSDSIVEKPSPTVVDVSDDEDPVASNDNFRPFAKQGSVRAPVSESSTRCDKSKTDSDTIHDVFHSRMEQFLSSSKSHQSVSGIVVSGRVMKRKVASYLILDSDSDFSDVEVCDGTSEIDTNKGAKISESASQPASNILRTLLSNVTPGPASVAGKPQESSKKSLSSKSSTVEETVAPHKEIVRYSADQSARRGHQNDGHCTRMGSDEETAFSSNLAKESDDEHGPQEQSGELLDLEFDGEVAEDFSEHEAEESNSCDPSSRGGHCDYEGDVLDSEELACLAYTAGHSPNFDGVTGSSGIQPLAISITEKSNKDLQAQSFRGCRTVASKELGQAVAGQKRRSNVKTHPVSCQPPTKFSRTGFTDIDRDSTKLPAVATDTAGRPSHACQIGTVRLSSSLIATSATSILEGLSSPSALTNTGWEAQHPVRPILLVKSSDRGVVSINNINQAFQLNPAIPQTNVSTEGVVFSSSIHVHKAESQGPQLQLGPHLLQSQTNAPTDLVDGPPDTDFIIRLGVDKVRSPASELFDDVASNNSAADHAWHLGTSPGGDQEENAFDQTDEVAVDTVVKRKPQSFDCAFHMQDELVDAESEMSEIFSLDITEEVVFSSSIHVHKAESQGPQLQLGPHLLQSQTNAPRDLVDGPPDTDFIIRLGVDKVRSPASELFDDVASNNSAADHAWHLGTSPGGDQEEDAFDQTDEVAVDTVVKRKPQSFDCAFHMQDELVDAESEMSETFQLDVTTLNDPEFQRCLTEPVPSKKMSSFLLSAQNAKFKVCHHCVEKVLNKPCLLWGKNKVVTTNVNGVLMVTIGELARIGFIDYHIAKHKLLNKKEFPAVWSYVIDKSNEGKAVLGVSLVFVVLVVIDTLTSHQYLPKRRRMLMKKGLKTPFKLVGKPYLPLHLEEPQKTHLLTNSTYTCSYITCTAVRAKRMSSRTASFPLFTNSSLNRDRNECLFFHAMDRVLYNSETRLIRKGFVPSLRLMYPPCPCQEVSKLDVREREAWKSSGRLPISSLQVLRFMGCNVFCFNEDYAGSQYMHVSVAELQHRELLPAQLGTNFFQDSNLLHETGDIRLLKEEERVFLTQYFDMTCENSIAQGYKLWYACTPFALQQLYQELSKTHYKYDQHSKALFYVMTLGHHCYWSLQVTPPTCQLHEVPGYEELNADKRPAAIVINAASKDETKTQRLKEAYYDGGGGTAPALKRLTQTLNVALQQTIMAFQLQDIAQPFCQCQVLATSLHKYRFLTFDDVELNHVTHMIFDGQVLHCWKRNYGFFVSWAELEAKDLLPRKRFGSAVAQFPKQPWCSFMLPSELKFLSCLPLEAQNGKNSHVLINIKFLHLWYGLFPQSEWPWCWLAERRFYVKLWKHSCPTKTESLEDAVQVVDLTRDERKAGITSSGSLSEGKVAQNKTRERIVRISDPEHACPTKTESLEDAVQVVDLTGDEQKAGITSSGSLSEGNVASLKAGITSSGSYSEGNITQNKARERIVRNSDPELLRLVPSVTPTSQPLRGSDTTSITGVQSTVERENEGTFHLTGVTSDQDRSQEIQPATVKNEESETEGGEHLTRVSSRAVCDCGGHQIAVEGFVKEETEADQSIHCNRDSERTQDAEDADHPAKRGSVERSVSEGMSVSSHPSTQADDSANQQARHPSVQQETSVSPHLTTRDGDGANQPARPPSVQPSVQPSTQPSTQPSFQQATSVSPHPTTQGGEAVCESYLNLKTSVLSDDLHLLPACPCPARPPGPFPRFSFLQCMCTAHSQFTILKDVRQAVIHNRLVYYFKAGYAVYFSLDYLKNSRVLNFSPKLSVLRSAWKKGSKNESSVVKSFLRENGEAEDGSEANDDLLIRPDQLRQIMASCGRSMDPLYLHQVGHICPKPRSIAHRAQRSDPHMKHVQSAWTRAFHWHQDFLKQLAAVVHDYNSAQQRTELPSTQQRKDVPSAEQRKYAPSAEQSTDVPSTYQMKDAPSTQQRKDVPPAEQRKDVPSTQQRPTMDSATGKEREGVVCVRTLRQTEDGAVGGQQSMDFVSIFPIPWKDFHLNNVKKEPSTEHQGSHTSDLQRDPAVRDTQENSEENQQGCLLPQGHSDCPGVIQEREEERVHASTPSHVPKHPEQTHICETHICGNLKMSEGSAVPEISWDEKNPGITPVAADQDRFTEAMTPSTLEGIVLQSSCKGVKILHSEEQVRKLLVDNEKGAMFSGHHILLTGTLTAADCRYVCFSVGGILYVNWQEVVNQVEEPSDRKVLFKQAQQLHAFLYQPPLYIVQLFSCRYGVDLDLLMSAPWVALNTLVAIYHLGSGILVREKMLKRFVDITPSSVRFGMFLLLRKDAG